MYKCNDAEIVCSWVGILLKGKRFGLKLSSANDTTVWTKCKYLK